MNLGINLMSCPESEDESPVWIFFDNAVTIYNSARDLSSILPTLL